jgi:hypothetical protein
VRSIFDEMEKIISNTTAAKNLDKNDNGCDIVYFSTESSGKKIPKTKFFIEKDKSQKLSKSFELSCKKINIIENKIFEINKVILNKYEDEIKFKSKLKELRVSKTPESKNFPLILRTKRRWYTGLLQLFLRPQKGRQWKLCIILIEYLNIF